MVKTYLVKTTILTHDTRIQNLSKWNISVNTQITNNNEMKSHYKKKLDNNCKYGKYPKLFKQLKPLFKTII